MNKEQSSTRVGGVDVSKARLDVAVHGDPEIFQFANTAAGHAALIEWCAAQGVVRVGLEASGGYERMVVAALTESGVAVVVHQPLEIRLFARIRRLRAKNDQLDARLIACATAQIDALKAAIEPRMVELAERLTAYEQAADLVTQVRTHLEHTRLPDLVAGLKQQLEGLLRRKRQLALDLYRRIVAFPDLARRLELFRSLPGVGPIVAICLVIRMPELGALRHGQAAALIGVAPFDRDSGACRGQRFIVGGRSRPRRMLYLAALAARRCDATFQAFAERLKTAGKAPKLILVAIMRKLIEAANLVIKRNQHWTKSPA
jgi:transposase